MSEKVRVAILDDHQSIIDGYIYRLSQKQEIEVVAFATFGVDLESMLVEHTIDVLLLDVQVPTSPNNPNPYPILHIIPKLLLQHPDLNILVISMHTQPTLINAVMAAGASGYILKDDFTTVQQLGEVVLAVAGGGIHLSQQAYQQLYRKIPKDKTPTPRQLEALSLCAAFPDATTTDLAEHLKVATSTARNLLSGAYIRLGVRNRAAAIMEARRLGLITPQQELPGV